MTQLPTPPDARTIERFESAEPEHAVTALAPLSHDTEKNRVELKNLVRDVTQAVESFAGEKAAADLQQQLEATTRQTQPVQRPATLCVLTDGTELETLLLPETFSAGVVHDSRYYVRPLIECAASHGEFLLLALAQGEVRLYRMSGEEMEPLHLEGLPGSLPDVVGHEVDGGTLQQHTADRTMFHGHGAGDDDHIAELEQFLRAVDDALTEDLHTREQYLMIAAVDEVAARFRHLSQHQCLLDETVTLSPDQTADEDLRQAAAEAFERWRERDNREFLEKLREEQHGQAASDCEQIVRAAEEGRVDTLLAGRDARLWGRFDPEQWSVEIHDDRHENSRDLVDLAMRAAWRQGGRIRIVDDESVLTNPLEARLRY